MEGVAELVEEGLALVEGEQRGFVSGGFGEVADHLDDGDDVVAVAVHFLSAEFSHPSTAAFAGTGVEVHIEYADDLVTVEDFVGVGLFVVGGEGVVLTEGDAVEFTGSGEGSFADVVEGEVGTHDIVVEVIFLFAEFLAVVAPVPRLQGFGLCLSGSGHVFAEHLLVFGAFLLGFGQGGSPDLHEAGVHGLGSLGQAVFQHIVGMGFVAKDVGTLKTEVGEGVDDFGVVKFAAVAAGGVGFPHLVAEFAVGAVLHEGFPTGHVKLEDEFAFGGGVGIGGLFGGGNLVSGDACRSGVEDELVGVGGFQHVLGEAEGERGYLLVELAETGLLLGGDVGAATHESFVCLLQQSHLLGVEVEALALVVDGLDALEEFGVEGDVVAVGRQLGGDLFGYGLHLVAVFAFAKVEKDAGDFVEQFAAVLVGLDGVLEGGCFGVVDDGVDFGCLLLHAFLEGGHVVLGLDFPKIGNFIGCAPFCEERIVHTFFASCCQQGGSCKPCNE